MGTVLRALNQAFAFVDPKNGLLNADNVSRTMTDLFKDSGISGWRNNGGK
jgi:hypothetical protein